MDEQSPGAAPLWPGPHDLAARLDRLEQRLADLEGLRPAVEGALVAQASRIESVLAAARRDLAETAVGDHVQAALARAMADGDDRLAEVRSALATSTAPVEALAGAVEALHDLVTQVATDAAEDRRAVRELLARVEAVPGAVDDGLARVVAALEEQRSVADQDRQALRDLQQDAIEQLRVATTDAVDEVRRAAAGATDRVAARLDEAGGRLERAVASLGAAEGAIGEHLAEADRRATLERARLTGAFVEQLADGLSRRERKRLARRLEVPEPAPPPDPTPPPAPPAGPRPDRPVDEDPDTHRDAAPVTAGSTSVPVSAQPAADTTTMPSSSTNGAPTTDAAARAPACSEEAPAAPARRRVRPSRRSRPVRATASAPGDPAAVRRALAAVRGLGPARQSALIDRFGSLEAIRDASDEELLELRGIGPSLLPGIRDAVRLPD